MNVTKLLQDYVVGVRDFSGAELISLCLHSKKLCGINFKDAKLTQTSLVKVDFFNANLSNAQLQGANLTSAFSWRS